MTKQKPPTWTQIKTKLSTFSQQELLNIIRNLYKLNPDNKAFLSTFLHVGDSRSLSTPYRQKIKTVFNPDRGFPKLNIRTARKALNDFKKASTNSEAIADLMIYYVEQGVQCTLKYGDIDERFYSSLESVFFDVVKLIIKTEDVKIIAEFYPRLEKIVKNTSGIGWGFHDYLYEIFYDDYPQTF